MNGVTKFKVSIAAHGKIMKREELFLPQHILRLKTSYRVEKK